MNSDKEYLGETEGPTYKIDKENVRATEGPTYKIDKERERKRKKLDTNDGKVIFLLDITHELKLNNNICTN